MLPGVLALQGDFEAHLRALERAGAPGIPVRTRRELERVDALVIPGGESTTMLRLLHRDGLFPILADRAARGLPILGTCAGVVLLARRVRPEQESLGLLDVAVVRNAYGRQVASAVVPLRVSGSVGGPGTMEGVFIRAPRIVEVGSGVEILAWRDDDPVLVRSGRVVAATFHPELTGDLRVHHLFLALAERPAA